MIRLKDLFYALAYCNQHIKTHKSECREYNISPSRFYNIKQDIVRYLISNQKSFGLEVTITSHEIDAQELGDVELIGILIKTQSLDELHVHQLYSGYDDLIPKESIPELTAYVPNHAFEFEWNENEFVKSFNTILMWAKEEKLERMYPTISDSMFYQRMKRWYWDIVFQHGSSKKIVRMKREGAPKRTWKKYNINDFRKNATEILNNIESSWGM